MFTVPYISAGMVAGLILGTISILMFTWPQKRALTMAVLMFWISWLIIAAILFIIIVAGDRFSA
jgi:hypothetical protein